MDDERIRRLTDEVLAALAAPAEPAAADLESRLTALEAAVRALQRERGAAEPVSRPAVALVAGGPAHPALQVLAVAGGSSQCVLEPDKPCVQSQRCRSFGH